jgi:RNA polymerase sigma-70 factor (ECF subfamily)
MLRARGWHDAEDPVASSELGLGARAALFAPARADAGRLRQLLARHYRDVWRVLRRLGVQNRNVEDAAQQVFIIVAGKLPSIREGSERAFLVSTAVRVAANTRRSAVARRETLDTSELSEQPDPAPAADVLIDQKRLRELLDSVLDELPDDLRSVFVLFELQGLPSMEIAELLGIPVGTVASRLRRARELFRTAAKRARARLGFRGGIE